MEIEFPYFFMSGANFIAWAEWRENLIKPDDWLEVSVFFRFSSALRANADDHMVCVVFAVVKNVSNYFNLC